jgi:hypothetical protein
VSRSVETTPTASDSQFEATFRTTRRLALTDGSPRSRLGLSSLSARHRRRLEAMEAKAPSIASM